MFHHIFSLVDCTPESHKLAMHLVQLAYPMSSCRVTLAAAVTPTDDPELRLKRRQHAEEALQRLHGEMKQYGVWTQAKVVEGEDHAAAFVEAARAARPNTLFDLIVLGTHQTLPEDPDEPCIGSLADRIARRTDLPIMILPSRHPMPEKHY
jgi:nucleotide-binding universal stress UspA family protein